MKEFIFTIIIPHYNSLDSLPRLLNSIPEREDIEVIVIDNSQERITVEDINSKRPFKLLYSPNSRYAGGARNVGLDAAHGKWLVFADADDFFTPEAFELFTSYANSDYDLIYFKVKSVYDDTLLPSDRDQMWNKIIDDYTLGKNEEIDARLSYLVPWGKMVKSDLVKSNNIRFDEVIAANDVMFSTKVGIKSNSFTVNEGYVYVVTTRAGSLANRRDEEVIKSRYLVTIRRNIYVRENGYKNKQGSIMIYLYSSLKFGFKSFVNFCWLAIKYRQNPLVGYRNWMKTFKDRRRGDNVNEKYVTR